MSQRVVEITAPSRLHFGMLSFGQPRVRQFGGAGAMIDAPCLQMRLSTADRPSIEAPPPLVERVQRCVQQVAKSWGMAALPTCRIEVLTAPRQHVGLGSGTQLALSVAAGLHALADRPLCSLTLRVEPLDSESQATRSAELAHSVERGRRSAIGLHGFLHGGLLMEAGKLHDQEISPLIARLELPSSWRWVLLSPRKLAGLSGEEERRAFERLPPVPARVTDELCRELLLHLLPAAAAVSFDDFSESLFRYGHAAGLCFASEQAGAFALPQSGRWVELLRGQGIRGVGQSSWGPTLFALAPSPAEADSLLGWLHNQSEFADLEVHVAATCNSGASVTIRPT